VTALPLLIGEHNPYSYYQDDALLPWPKRASGHRLMMRLGMTEDEYLERFDRMNLVVGERWSAAAARRNARAILEERPSGVLVMLGRKVTVAVCGAARVDAVAPFCSVAAGERVLVSLPHPSGLNRAWNEPGAEGMARAALRFAVEACS